MDDKNVTLLDDLLNELNIDPTIDINSDNICIVLIDFSIPVETRIRAIEMYYKYYNTEIVEVLKRLISIFNFSLSVVVKEYIQKICVFSEIPFMYRLETAKDLCFCQDTDDCFMPLDIVCNDLKYYNDIPTPKKTEAVCVLMRRNKFKENATRYFFEILDNESIEPEYRYRMITSLKTTFDNRKTWATKEEKLEIDQDRMYYERVSYVHFIQNSNNPPTTRILSGQVLLVQYSSQVTGIEDILIEIANNIQNEYNVRADATDVVLRYGTEKYKIIAKDIITELSKVDMRDVKNIYENAQNAHSVTIEDSAVKSLEALSLSPLCKKDDSEDFIDFDYVFNKIVKSKNKCALNRIGLDNALYSKMNFSLKHVLVMVYSNIQNNEYKEVLLERLDEELAESSGICSTGILERLVNTLSGFDDTIGIRISFEDQILGNLSGRLNSKIRSLVNEKCLHKTNKNFCTCLYDCCEYTKELMTSTKREKRTYTPCKKCVGCTQGEKTNYNLENFVCIHECVEDSVCNETLVDMILAQMTIPTKHFERRIMFLKFFRIYISDIMEDIRDEFKDYVDIPSFDLYFRKAIINYEGEN